MRSECVFCGVALTPATRAVMRSQFTRSGFIASNKSWCQPCDSFDAAVRADKIMRRQYKQANRERARESDRKRRQRDDVRAHLKAYHEMRRFRSRKSFRCVECHGRFPGVKHAWVHENGTRTYLGVCTLCRPDYVRRIDLKDARRKWEQSEKGKAWRKAYRQREHVKAQNREHTRRSTLRRKALDSGSQAA